ncbi:VOC family protein [Arthrobacter mobilis]|uniref:VOC family protein n=1 Tax=Arthrobacter mobilis TaxID=2724944 RepID=A0A7X6HEU5_9MICC|nr:VOC family protein [Arthrobacter mobilis]NKX55843.1 VOC family protein [Arthrobacter mobilis]
MSGRVVHFEIPADDTGRASEFYRSVFGWNLSPMPEVDYIAVGTTPADEQGMPLEPGAINGGMFKRSDNAPRSPVITIDVDDIDGTLEKIGTQGGSTVVPRQPVMDMGYFAYFQDSEGNVMGLWQSA